MSKVDGGDVMKTTAQATILIVEDDHGFRETFADIMALKGVAVKGAGSAKEAVEMVSKMAEAPAVIICDVQLPDMHGFELCRRLKKLPSAKDRPVILVSAASRYNDPRDRVEGLLAGAALFLPKPITMDRLWSEIELLLQRR